MNDPNTVDQFLTRSFPDARELMPQAIAEFSAHTIGFLGEVSASPWHTGGTAALIGDAAHAMVPFHGQGMNCCFEDCIEFDACVARHAPANADSWAAAFAEFGAARKPNTDAIAAMALENYLEMRKLVADPEFQLQQALSLELERRFPRQFIPRYSMVMFHHENPYLTAQRRGAANRLKYWSALTEGAALVDTLVGHRLQACGTGDQRRAAALLGPLERDETVSVGVVGIRPRDARGSTRSIEVRASR